MAVRYLWLVIFVLMWSPCWSMAGQAAAAAGEQPEAAAKAFPEADLGDFEEDESVPDLPEREPVGTQAKEVFYTIGGHLKIGSRYNYAQSAPAAGQTDWREFSSLRSEILLELDLKLPRAWKGYVSATDAHEFIYRIRGRDRYTDDVLKDSESYLDLRDTYLQGSLLRNLDLKVGRQIVVWGKSDNIRVTDIMNPLEWREPGVTDLEDLRLPVAMTRLDYYYGKWSLTGLAVHEHRFNNNPVFGSDFFPYDTPLPEEETPSGSIANTEYGLSLSGVFSGWDIAFYYADVYDDQAHLELLPHPVLRHQRIAMVGSAFNIASGNWLYKLEAAWLDGIRISDTIDGSGIPAIRSKPYDRMDILAGIEYTGFTDTMISVEAANNRIANHDAAIQADGQDRDSFQGAVRISRDFFYETLNLTFLALWYGLDGADGALFRISGEYDLTDNIEISAGIVDYNAGKKPELRKISNNDRIYLNGKYSF